MADVAKVREQSSSGRAGALWLIQAMTGLLLIGLLALHMTAHHFVVEGGLRTFAEVVAYVANPAIFFLEVTFLVIVTIHALLGVRAVIVDLGPGRRAVRTLDTLLWIVGTAVITYGVWLLIVIRGSG
ncbi:MAG: hypothetical protein AB1791_09060 [Chloroflexota bacterium]